MVQPTVQPTLSHWSTSARCPANATAWHALASSCYGRQSAPRGQTARQNANGIRLKRQRKLLLHSLTLMMLRGVTIGVLRYVRVRMVMLANNRHRAGHDGPQSKHPGLTRHRTKHQGQTRQRWAPPPTATSRTAYWTHYNARHTVSAGFLH